MKAMRVELTFFDGDEPLTRAVVLVYSEEDCSEIVSERGDKFEVTRQFEEPASRLFVKSYDQNGELVGCSAMRMGVHNSDDWEMVELVEPYEMCFRCAIVDCDNPDWETQELLPDDTA